MARSALERLITDFNYSREDWRLSLSAQNLLREIFISLNFDELGLKGLKSPEERRLAQQKAIERLPGFLGELAAEAEKVSTEEKSGDERVIGAIFVSFRIKKWFEGCGCLPRD
jgi:hypothetical protein